MVYDHRKIDQMVTRLQDLDPWSPVPLATFRLQFVYLAVTVAVLSDVLGQPIGHLAKSTQDDYATVMIGRKAHSIGWKRDPLANQPLAIRFRRNCYTFGFLLRDRNIAFVFLIALILLLPWWLVRPS